MPHDSSLHNSQNKMSSQLTPLSYFSSTGVAKADVTYVIKHLKLRDFQEPPKYF